MGFDKGILVLNYFRPLKNFWGRLREIAIAIWPFKVRSRQMTDYTVRRMPLLLVVIL